MRVYIVGRNSQEDKSVMSFILALFRIVNTG